MHTNKEKEIGKFRDELVMQFVSLIDLSEFVSDLILLWLALDLCYKIGSANCGRMVYCR